MKRNNVGEANKNGFLGFKLGVKYNLSYNEEGTHSYTRYGCLLFNIHVSKDNGIKQKAISLGGAPFIEIKQPGGETTVKGPFVKRF